MKRIVFLLSLILCIVSIPLSSISAAEVTLRADETKIAFTNFDNREIKIYFSDFTGSTALCVRDSAQAFFGKYELSKPLGQPDNFYKFEIRPKDSTANGTYSVFVRHCGSNNAGLELVVSVNIDAKLFGLYNVAFELDCPDTNFGETIYCYVTGQATGPQYKSVDGDFNVDYFVRKVGTQKWKLIRSKTLGFDEGVAVGLTTISKPTEIRVKVIFENDQYELNSEVYPKPNLKIRAPRALMVGQSFTLTVSSVKNFSGKCKLNAREVFRVVNGFGSIRLATRVPGKLDLTVECGAPNWASTFAYEYLWVRN